MRRIVESPKGTASEQGCDAGGVHLGQRGSGEAAIELVGIPSVTRKKWRMKDIRRSARWPNCPLSIIDPPACRR